MKKIFLYLLLALSLSTNAQNKKAQFFYFLNQQAGGSSPVDYSPLYTEFDHLFIPDAENSVYSDLARTTLAVDGDAVKSITDLSGSQNLQWNSSNTRRSYLDVEHGGRYNLDFPIYKKPSGQKAHVSFFNMIDQQFASGTFTALNSPNTAVFVIRSRQAVQDEGGVGLGVYLRDRGYDHLEISNNAGSVELNAASGIPAFDQISILYAIDHGASSSVYLNNVLLGTVETLSASSITQLFYGTNSHIWEHDLLLTGVIHSALDATARNNLTDLLDNYYTVDERPQGAHLYSQTVSFDGTDTFTFSGTFYDPNALSENTSLREYEWFVFKQNSNLAGHTGLDTQQPVGRGTTLKRGDHPEIFAGVEGTSNVYVAARVKAYNTSSQSWSGIPPRSVFVVDNTTGTPVTTGQVWVNSVVVSSGTPKRIDVGLTSTSGGGTYSGGNVNHFKVYKNGTEISKTIDLTDLASGTVHLTVVDDIVFSDELTLTHLPDATTPLQNSLGFTAPQFTTGNYLEFENNTTGPVSIYVNLSQSVDGTTPPWNNANVGSGGVATLIADLDDDSGAATGISLAITEAGQGWTGSDYGSAGTLFNETNVTQRGAGVWQGGNFNTTLRFAGLTAGQTFDISYAIAKTGNGGAGNVVINGGAPIAFDSSSYTEFTSTGLVADGSGNVDFTMTITGSGDEAALLGIILTIYP